MLDFIKSIRIAFALLFVLLSGPAIGRCQSSVATLSTDVFFWNIELDVEADSGFLIGKVETHFYATEPEAFLAFDLSNALTTDSVLLNGNSVSFAHLPGNELRIFAALAAGNSYTATIYYRGIPVQGAGLGGFYAGKRQGIPEVWTLSQPFAASDWWPTKNTLSDKADSLRMEFHCDSALRVAAPGTLQHSSPGYSVWMHSYPIPAYLVAFSLTNYDTLSLHVRACTDSIPFAAYTFPEGSQPPQLQAKAVQAGLDLYCDWLGPYPYANEKYGHAQFSRGGGMEHPTFSFMGGFGLELTLHELVHQWVGNMVTCGSWAHIWLNEGFATYLSGMGIEQIQPEQWLNWKQSQRQAVWSEPHDGAVFVRDSLVVQRIFSSRLSYKKAALVLHQLRLWLGDSVFKAGLKQYLNSPELKWGFARTEDFQRAMESASGKPLQDFFNGWIYAEGVPELQIQVQVSSAQSVAIHIEQLSNQADERATPSWVSLSFRGIGKEQRLEFMLNSTIFDTLIDCSFLPLDCRLDPEANMLALAELSFKPLELPGGILFPNPGIEPVLVCQEPPESIRLFDAGGRFVKALHGFSCGQPLPFGLNLDPGIYWIECKVNGVEFRYKFVRAQH